MKIYGVWHFCLEGKDAEYSANAQLTKLKESGLLSATDILFINVVGGDFGKWISPLFLNIPHIVFCRSITLHDFEYSSLKIIYDLANLGSVHSPQDLQPYSKVLHPFKLYYMHSKGAFIQDQARYINSMLWREYMEYFVINKWRDCVAVLDQYDICGVEWRTDPLPHFSGNFWWATDSYLQKLPNIIDYWSANKFERIWAEMYIGHGNPTQKDFSNFGQDMYVTPITKNMYIRN